MERRRGKIFEKQKFALPESSDLHYDDYVSVGPAPRETATRAERMARALKASRATKAIKAEIAAAAKAAKKEKEKEKIKCPGCKRTTSLWLIPCTLCGDSRCIECINRYDEACDIGNYCEECFFEIRFVLDEENPRDYPESQ